MGEQKSIKKTEPAAGSKEARKAAAPDPAQLAAMLAARELRWQKRMTLAGMTPSLISATLCVPLPFRTQPEAEQILRECMEKLTEELQRAGLGPGTALFLNGADGPAVFLPCDGAAKAVKHFCVEKEETLPLGRLLDLDVTGQDGVPVGRAELGLPPRKCFLCGRPAAECVAAARHDAAQIAAFVEAFLKNRGSIVP